MTNPIDPPPVPTDEQLRAVRERQNANTWAGLIPPPPGVSPLQFGQPPGGLLGAQPMGVPGQFLLPLLAPTDVLTMRPANPGSVLGDPPTVDQLRAAALANLARYGSGLPGVDPPAPAPMFTPDPGLMSPAPIGDLGGQFGLPMGPSHTRTISTVPNPGEPNGILSGLPTADQLRAEALANLARARNVRAGIPSLPEQAAADRFPAVTDALPWGPSARDQAFQQYLISNPQVREAEKNQPMPMPVAYLESPVNANAAFGTIMGILSTNPRNVIEGEAGVAAVQSGTAVRNTDGSITVSNGSVISLRYLPDRVIGIETRVTGDHIIVIAPHGSVTVQSRL